MYLRTDPTEVIAKGKARGVTIEKSANPEAPETYFEFAPPVINPPAVPAEALAQFAAEGAAEDARVAKAQAEVDDAEREYQEALANLGAYANDNHLVALVSKRTVKADLLQLAKEAQAEGEARRAKLIADGIPEAFEKAKAAQSVANFRKRCEAANERAEQAGKLLGEARQLMLDAVHAQAPLAQEAQRLATLLGLRGFRPDGGTDTGDATRLVADALQTGYRSAGGITIELRRWLGS